MPLESSFSTMSNYAVLKIKKSFTQFPRYFVPY
nr:MAG TPA: hypothetical protein [Caudoviricetes sp.]